LSSLLIEPATGDGNACAGCWLISASASPREISVLTRVLLPASRSTVSGVRFEEQPLTCFTNERHQLREPIARAVTSTLDHQRGITTSVFKLRSSVPIFPDPEPFCFFVISVQGLYLSGVCGGFQNLLELLPPALVRLQVSTLSGACKVVTMSWLDLPASITERATTASAKRRKFIGMTAVGTDSSDCTAHGGIVVGH